jgi:prepilin-type N-terminal cleavage/methylation domain-containing protein
MVRRTPSSDSGFTLIEVLATMVLFGILSTIAVGGYRQYDSAHEQQGSADKVVSVLRNTQQRATSEGRTYCIRIGSDARSWTVWRTACGTGTQRSSDRTGSAKTTMPAADRSFVSRDGVTSSTDIYFYRSGMASAGSLKVVKTGRSKVYTIRVEGLTGRVASS